MKIKFIIGTIALIVNISLVNAQEIKFDAVYPPYWFNNLKNDTLQLLFYRKNVANTVFTIVGNDAKILKSNTFQNKNYLAIDVQILNKNSSKINFTIFEGKKKQNFTYELKPVKSSSLDEVLSSSDFIYLITPDRFVNGDSKNDNNKAYFQSAIDRQNMNGRHGGDIQGIINQLDYISDLGATALWINPLVENNQPEYSYHGYAITDFYKIDRRYGDENLYQKMVDDAHNKNLKIILDVVYNHCGNEAIIFKDLIDSTWFNFWPQFTRTSYRSTTYVDPYASKYDKAIFENGWFDNHMPDFNQKNTFVQRFFIQNSIWWIASFGLDAFRIDTYAYPDQEFMKNLLNAVSYEFPAFPLFAEIWVQGTTIQANYVGTSKLSGKVNSKLNSITDFQLYYAINKMCNEKFGWTEGVSAVYHTLADDYVYKDPNKLITFVDNHDLDRFYGVINEDFNKYKMGLGLLLTTRGIPSIYYGTEILMKNKGEHGLLRQDFPGGWQEDKINKFEANGRNEAENLAFNFIKKLANYRKKSNALTKGKLTQFVPENGIYVYFREFQNELIMIVINTNIENKNLDLKRFEEKLNNKTSFIDVLNNSKSSIENQIEMKGSEILILNVE